MSLPVGTKGVFTFGRNGMFHLLCKETGQEIELIQNVQGYELKWELKIDEATITSCGDQVAQSIQGLPQPVDVTLTMTFLVDEEGGNEELLVANTPTGRNVLITICPFGNTSGKRVIVLTPQENSGGAILVSGDASGKVSDSFDADKSSLEWKVKMDQSPVYSTV